jgi:hypothetical protein
MRRLDVSKELPYRAAAPCSSHPPMLLTDEGLVVVGLTDEGLAVWGGHTVRKDGVQA